MNPVTEKVATACDPMSFVAMYHQIVQGWIFGITMPMGMILVGIVARFIIARYKAIQGTPADPSEAAKKVVARVVDAMKKAQQ